MPSPFPGMNPYLEQEDAWEDFHQNFITRAREVLAGQLGPNHLVKIKVRFYRKELSAEERRYFVRAEFGVMGTPAPDQPGVAPKAVAAPVQLTMPAVDVERHSSLEVWDRRHRRLVTVVELLSPTNKTPGADRDEYLLKRARVLSGPTHLVEIDLRRGGERPRPPELPACDYYVLVARAQDWPRMGFWPLRLRDPLPTVPIPLSAPDADVLLDLQALLHRVYDAANYGKYIYGETPQPSLNPDDALWARQFVPTTQ